LHGYFVDQGSFAHANAARSSSAPTFYGEKHLYPSKWNEGDEVRTRDSLFSALKVFFKDNPAWE